MGKELKELRRVVCILKNVASVYDMCAGDLFLIDCRAFREGQASRTNEWVGVGSSAETYVCDANSTKCARNSWQPTHPHTRKSHAPSHVRGMHKEVRVHTTEHDVVVRGFVAPCRSISFRRPHGGLRRDTPTLKHQSIGWQLPTGIRAV